MTEIQKLYRLIPQSICKEGCADCCKDIIQVAPEENDRMGGYQWSGGCIFLKDNQCSVHDRRAFICRLFGTSEIMKCSNCIPERYLSETETKDIINNYVMIKKQQESLE
ncbi:MAG: hypothetical protein FWG98_02815 [Candidatus Cloacimonetes bacterium]|nr:hypothetical protein [Candidatus Cloacimonadota bacterium]